MGIQVERLVVLVDMVAVDMVVQGGHTRVVAVAAVPVKFSMVQRFLL